MVRLRSRNSPVVEPGVEAEFYNKCGFIDILRTIIANLHFGAITSRACLAHASVQHSSVGYRDTCGSRRYPEAKSGLVLVALEIMRPVVSSSHLLGLALLSE